MRNRAAHETTIEEQKTWMKARGLEPITEWRDAKHDAIDIYVKNRRGDIFLLRTERQNDGVTHVVFPSNEDAVELRRRGEA